MLRASFLGRMRSQALPASPEAAPLVSRIPMSEFLQLLRDNAITAVSYMADRPPAGALLLKAVAPEGPRACETLLMPLGGVASQGSWRQARQPPGHLRGPGRRALQAPHHGSRPAMCDEALQGLRRLLSTEEEQEEVPEVYRARYARPPGVEPPLRRGGLEAAAAAASAAAHRPGAGRGGDLPQAGLPPLPPELPEPFAARHAARDRSLLWRLFWRFCVAFRQRLGLKEAIYYFQARAEVDPRDTA